MNRSDVTAFSRYLRSKGYTTRTVQTASGRRTQATKRQADHVQVYQYPWYLTSGQQGIRCADYFGVTVYPDGGVSPVGGVRTSEIPNATLRFNGFESVLSASGGLDYYGPAEPQA